MICSPVLTSRNDFLIQVLGADMAKMFPGKSAEEVMAMFDKDGTGQLDMAELQTMKDSFKKSSTVRQEPALMSTSSKSKVLSKVLEEPAGNFVYSSQHCDSAPMHCLQSRA